MDIRFTCGACGQRFEAPEDMAGQTVACPNPSCGKPVTVPAATAAPVEATVASPAPVWRPPPPPPPVAHGPRPAAAAPAAPAPGTPPVPPASPARPAPPVTPPRPAPARPPARPRAPAASAPASKPPAWRVALALARRFLVWGRKVLFGLAGWIERVTASLRTGRAEVGPQEYRDAVQRLVKCAVGIVALFVLQWILGLFVKSRGYRGVMMAGDWIHLAVAIAVAVLAVRAHRPVRTLAVFHALSARGLRRWLGGEAWMGDLATAIGHAVLLLLAGGLYAFLLPHVAHFNEAVLHFPTLTTILSVAVLLAALGVLLMLWKSLQPAIDHLTARLAEKVSVAAGAVDPVRCPACYAANDPAAAVCAFCGAAMQAPESPAAPPETDRPESG
ncbi:MAG: hypothetical protein FJ221_06590 [Lentisphaerae bacterium]|nr:hypothetical protein [Lentisphaerota bacterium]